MSNGRQQGSAGQDGGHRTGTAADGSQPADERASSGRYVTDGGRGELVAASGFDLGELVRFAGLAALIVAGIQVIISIVTNLVGPGSLLNVSQVLTQLIGIIGSLAFIAAVVAVAVVGAEKQVVLWGSIGIYALGLLDSLLSSFVVSILSSTRAGIGLGINTFVFPLYSVATFLGIVMAYRLYQGKTILPGVDVRL